MWSRLMSQKLITACYWFHNFYFNKISTCRCHCKPHTCRKYTWLTSHRSTCNKHVIVIPNNCWSYKCLVSNSVDIIMLIKWKKSETSDMSLPTFDLFCSITSHMQTILVPSLQMKTLVSGEPENCLKLFVTNLCVNDFLAWSLLTSTEFGNIFENNIINVNTKATRTCVSFAFKSTCLLHFDQYIAHTKAGP